MNSMQKVPAERSMAKMVVVVVVVMMIIAAAGGTEAARGGRRRGNGGSANKENKVEEKKMVFYMHDIPGGRNPTAVVVAGPMNGKTARDSMGTTLVIDDKITEGPESGWREIGRGQGIYSLATWEAAAQKQNPALFLAFTAIFHYPESLNESTIVFMGSDRVFQATRDLVIVGGTGVFRGARGVATLSTFSFTPPNAIIKFDLSFTFSS